MRTSSVTIALGLHIAAFVLGIVSFPWLKKDYVIPPPVSVEMVTIDEMNQTIKQAELPPKKVEKKVEKPPAPPKPAPSATNTSKEMVKPTKEIKKEEPVKKDETVVVDPNAHPDKKLDKKDEKKKKVAEEPKKDFSAVLKNLAEEKPQEKTEKIKDLKPDEPAPREEGRPVPLGQRMTMTEMDALRAQLEGCWNVPVGAKDVENTTIDIFMVINRDRTLRSAEIVDTSRYNSDSFFRAIADTAMRAVRSPNCSPFDLPPDKYESWNQVTVTFDPSQMF